MAPTDEIPGGTPRARIAVREEEPPADALLRAAERVDVDVRGSGDRLHEAVDADAIDRLFDDPGDGSGARALVVRHWDRTFVIGPRVIGVYE